MPGGARLCKLHAFDAARVSVKRPERFVYLRVTNVPLTIDQCAGVPTNDSLAKKTPNGPLWSLSQLQFGRWRQTTKTIPHHVAGTQSVQDWGYESSWEAYFGLTNANPGVAHD